MIKEHKFILRGWQIEDAESLTENADNIHIWNNVRDYFPHPYTRNDAETFIGFVMNKPKIEDFAIEIEGKAVGGIGIVPQSDVERLNAEIGYWLGEKYWNKGIMTNVVKATINYVFENTEIIRLFAPVFDFNIASMNVLKKSGFKEIAILKKAAIKNNKIINMHYFELLKGI